MMNLFQPSVKLVRNVRVGARLRRVYDRPQTPLDRLLATPRLDQARLAPYVTLRARLDPFALAQTIDRKLVRIYQLASRSPRPQPAKHGTPPPRPTSAADRIMHQEWRRRMDQALVTATGSPVRNCVAR